MRTIGDVGTWGWLFERNWTELSHFSIGEIRRSVDVLQKLFPDLRVAQFTEGGSRNIVVTNLCYGKSLEAHHYLIRLGLDIDMLAARPGLRSVLKRLQGSSESESASMEITLAGLLARNEFQVAFPVPNGRAGKTTDIVAERDGQRISFECKKLRQGRKSEWLDRYNHLLSTKLFECAREGSFDLQLELIRPRECDGDVNRAVDLAFSRMRGLITTPRWGMAYIYAPGLCRGTLTRDAQSESYVNMPIPTEYQVFQRLMSNGIEPAALQISSVGLPGVAAIISRDMFESEPLQEAFCKAVAENRATFDLLSAVLVFRPQGLGPYRAPAILVNETANTHFNQLRVANVIRKTYGLNL